MAIESKFGNIVPTEKTQNQKPTKLTVLDSADPNTIYRLIFEDKPKSRQEN